MLDLTKKKKIFKKINGKMNSGSFQKKIKITNKFIKIS